MIHSEQFLRLKLNLDLHCEPEIINNALKNLDTLVKYLKGYPEVLTRKKLVKNSSFPMRYIILDFEGYFPTLFGFLIHDTIYQFYIEQEKYQQQ